MSGKFVAYLRVSRKSQGADGLGIDAQRRAVAAYLVATGAKSVGEFVEVESGRSDERPKLAEAIALTKLTGARLLIAKLDRLSRDVRFLTGLEKQGVDFIACDMPHANRLTVNIMASVAQDERERISLRTREGLASIKAKLASGAGHVSKRSGKPVERLGNPNGLTVSRPDLGAQAVQKRASDFAAMVGPKIAGYRAAGMTLQQVADALTAASVQTPRGGIWTPTAVKRVIARGGRENAVRDDQVGA